MAFDRTVAHLDMDVSANQQLSRLL